MGLEQRLKMRKEKRNRICRKLLRWRRGITRAISCNGAKFSLGSGGDPGYLSLLYGAVSFFDLNSPLSFCLHSTREESCYIGAVKSHHLCSWSNAQVCRTWTEFKCLIFKENSFEEWFLLQQHWPCKCLQSYRAVYTLSSIPQHIWRQASTVTCGLCICIRESGRASAKRRG